MFRCTLYSRELEIHQGIEGWLRESIVMEVFRTQETARTKSLNQRPDVCFRNKTD